MDLKERLTSTENLLRSIRGGETFRPGMGGEKKPRAPREPRQRFWNMPLSLGRPGGGTAVGVSMSSANLTVVAVRKADASILGALRLPFGPGQSPGEAGFPAFLRAGVERLLGKGPEGVEIWAVLRSPDVDLTVLSVPKLSGDKLDAAVYWTLQKDKKFSDDEYALDYLVMGPTVPAQARPAAAAAKAEPGAEKAEAAKKDTGARLDVLTCLARKADVEALATAFRQAGLALTGVTLTPAALLGLYRLPGAPGPFDLAANIHVENDFTAIGLYTSDRMVFSRYIRSGATGMADELVEHFRALAKPSAADMHDIDLELPLPGTIGGADGPPSVPLPVPPQAMDHAQAEALIRHVLMGGPEPEGLAPEHRLERAQVLEIVAPALERLARQVERTLEYYASSQQLRCDALHFSGAVFASAEVLQALAGQLGYPAVLFDAPGILRRGQERVAGDLRMSVCPALAASLCDAGKGINLVANYKRRAAQARKQLASRAILVGLAALMLCIAGAGLFLELGNRAKRQELEQAKRELAALGPVIEDSALQAALAQFQARQAALRSASGRLAAPAVVAEMARRTPENVKLMSLSLDMVAPPQPPGQPAAAPPPGQPGQPGQNGKPAQRVGVLTLEGIVTGDKGSFDTRLAQFVMQLQSSPLLSQPVVHQTGLRDLPGEGQVLFFVLHTGVL